MNLLLKKAAAILTAGIITAASLGAECFAEGLKPEITTFSFAKDAAVSKPTYQVKGTAGVRKIALSTTTVGATIYFTTDGSVPTTKSRKYTKLLSTKKDVKIRAIAVKNGISSAVMTKSFKIKTMLGDVTGDGNINRNDYNKLRNYINKKTKYICKDNADCNGSGGISTKDLTVLSQYLSGKISDLPSNPVTTVKKPTRTISSIYGGKSVSLSCETSGATIYYTLDGSTPDQSSGIRYTSAFTLTSSKNVKAIAYKNGDQSALKSFDVTVGTIGDVRSDKNTNMTYTTEISVALSSSGSSKILYTDDGSDPRTSLNAKTYYSPIKLSKDTTIKAYARAYGCADSDVETFNYKVDAGFSISGTVWDDTPLSATTANGVKASGESGIGGIKVYLMNTATKAYTMTTTTDNNGNYIFTDIPTGYSYKIVFEFNGQLYRAFSAVVASGNQAVSDPYQTVKIKNGGTYNNGGSLINTINSYATAKTNTYYNTVTATTNATYYSSATNVDLALVSRNYGILDLTLSVTGANAGGVAFPGDKLTYTITLTNNSPITSPVSSSAILTDAEINLYVSDVLDEPNFIKKTTNQSIFYTNLNGGYRKLTWSEFVDSNNGLAPGKSVSFGYEGKVRGDLQNQTQIKAFAEVNAYSFSTGCYDYYSVPGNFTPSLTRALEHDEAAAAVITVNNGSSSGTDTTTQTISALSGVTDVMPGQSGRSQLIVKVTNCKSINDVIIAQSIGSGTITVESTIQDGNDLLIFFSANANANALAGTKITVDVALTAKNKVTLTANVKAQV